MDTTTSERPTGSAPDGVSRVAVVGAGRLGTVLAAELRAAGLAVEGPLGRAGAGGPSPSSAADAVLLCVPDAEIAAAASALGDLAAGVLVGHCSGATTLAPLGTREGFSLHPLMTVPAAGATTAMSMTAGQGHHEARDDHDVDATTAPTGAMFAGATAAVAGSTPRALALAQELARALGMVPVEVADEDRAAYHAAASIASNFLVALEDAAERLAATAGLPRERLLPLVRASVEAWAAHGGERALTGPIARGDETTVSRQRASVAERCPDDLPLFDALADATRRLAARDRVAADARPARDVMSPEGRYQTTIRHDRPGAGPTDTDLASLEVFSA